MASRTRMTRAATATEPGDEKHAPVTCAVVRAGCDVGTEGRDSSLRSE